MKNKIILCITALSLLMGCNKSTSGISEEVDTSKLVSFSNVGVHDPSIIKDSGTYYIVGSHMAFAKSNNLKDWTQLETNVSSSNSLFNNPTSVLSSMLTYAQTSTVWAGDMIKLADGKYYYYISACKGDRPLSELGVAKASSVTGKYESYTKIFRSGGTSAPNGDSYSASTQPNAVDPAVFYDKDDKLWMVYGSYSGGIFITELDPTTGLIKSDSSISKENSGWGKRLLGNYHARIEAPYIVYNESNGYYYLFLSFGGLDANGNYNVRVARSKNPTGPYEDAENPDMSNAMGTSSYLFDDENVSDYGVKLLGNYTWSSSTSTNQGYVSPGHNSAYYDAETGKYFIIFHSRFPGQGETHQVRVHEMKFNSEGWPVVLPFRYTGLDESATISSLSGTYKVIVDKPYETEITTVKGITYRMSIPTIKTPINYVFNIDGTVTGSDITSGTWSIGSSNQLTLELVRSGTTYKYYGFVQKQYNEYENKIVTSFSVMEKDGYGIIAYQ